jgi:hypothetical protein
LNLTIRSSSSRIVPLSTATSFNNIAIAAQIEISRIVPPSSTTVFHNIALATQIRISSIIPPIATLSFSNVIFAPLNYGIVPPSSAPGFHNIALAPLLRQAKYGINTATLRHGIILRIVAHRNARTAAAPAAWANVNNHAAILQTTPHINRQAI